MLNWPINTKRGTLDAVERDHGVLWRFDTARYTVAFWAEDEDLAPEDHFCDARDVAFARQDIAAHWFCAFVGVFDEDGDCISYDCLGVCSYNSFEEFYSSHRWQYQRAGARQGKWLKDPKQPAFQRALKRRQGHNGTYFTDMVREALQSARNAIALQSEGSRRA